MACAHAFCAELTSCSEIAQYIAVTSGEQFFSVVFRAEKKLWGYVSAWYCKIASWFLPWEVLALKYAKMRSFPDILVTSDHSRLHQILNSYEFAKELPRLSEAMGSARWVRRTRTCSVSLRRSKPQLHSENQTARASPCLAAAPNNLSQQSGSLCVV